MKRFENEHSLWKRRQEYSYDDILKVCENVTQQFYLELLLPGSGKQKVA